MARNYGVKVGDKGTVVVTVTRVEDQGVTFTIQGFGTPITMYHPDITVVEAARPTGRKHGEAFLPDDGE